jgi:hypothetical protein
VEHRWIVRELAGSSRSETGKSAFGSKKQAPSRGKNVSSVAAQFLASALPDAARDSTFVSPLANAPADANAGGLEEFDP